MNFKSLNSYVIKAQKEKFLRDSNNICTHLLRFSNPSMSVGVTCPLQLIEVTDL